MDSSIQYQIGLDLHKKNSVLSVVDSDGKKLGTHQIPNRPEELDVLFDSFAEPIHVTFEATRNYFWLADYLNLKRIPFTMANPFLNRAIATVHAKNDKYDSAMLAQLSRAGMVATCYVPDIWYRHLRELNRQRYRLVTLRTSLKNTIRAYLDKYNFQGLYKYVFGSKGIRWIEAQNFPEPIRKIIAKQLNLIETFSIFIDELYEMIKNRILNHPFYPLLNSIDGVGVVHASTIIAEIVKVHRFPRIEPSPIRRIGCQHPGISR
ncbi:transposase [candidate division KSB1 bacterium]|nr:transposase [candidate division KSB1 bacterium]